MKVFFDTSAFVKRYVNEAGSQAVVEICQNADTVALSIICLPEIISTLRRLVREGNLSEQQYHNIKVLIFNDFEDIDICELTSEVMLHIISSLETNSLRAMDAIHLGCALAYAPDKFVSSDKRQINAAHAVGLTVVEV